MCAQQKYLGFVKRIIVDLQLYLNHCCSELVSYCIHKVLWKTVCAHYSDHVVQLMIPQSWNYCRFLFFTSFLPTAYDGQVMFSVVCAILNIRGLGCLPHDALGRTLMVLVCPLPEGPARVRKDQSQRGTQASLRKDQSEGTSQKGRPTVPQQ